MKIQLLPSTFDENKTASPRQHLSCFIVDDCLAIDAGSLAMAATEIQKQQIRDVALTHAHLDHIAGLPLFIDDLFATLKSPVHIHSIPTVIETLERDIFNWTIYPRFSDLKNDHGAVMKYQPFEIGQEFSVKHLRLKSIRVNHKVPTVGFIVRDDKTTIALTGDTSRMEDFWETVNVEKNLAALLIECALPNELEDLANASHHLTPKLLQKELEKFDQKESLIYVINIKPMHRNEVVRQIEELKIKNLQILEVGRIYEF